MEKQILKDILLVQDKQQKLKEKYVFRDLFTKINEFTNTQFILIITGIRRCGKSTLLKQFRNKNTYYVNFDDERFINFSTSDFQMLYETLIELFGEKEIFLFDEIQNIRGWERFVRRLHNENKKILITGSNATMLSKELGTHLTGRYISFELFPFSFSEFSNYKNYKIENLSNLTSIEISNIKKLFN